MKKVISIIIIFLVFIIVYLLQSNFFINFSIAGIKPNLIVILVLFLGLYAGRKIGIISGFFFGVLVDVFIGRSIGISSIMLMSIGFLGGYFDKNFDKEIKVSMILMVIGSTLLYEIGKYLLDIIFNSLVLEVGSFIKILSVETAYNVIILIIIYPLLKKGGYHLEKIYKYKEVLTRYF